MSNLSDLFDAYVVKANLITDALEKIECLVEIDSWYACRQALDALNSKELASYSMNGKTVTRQNIPSIRNEETRHLANLKGLLEKNGVHTFDAGGGLVDMSSQWRGM
jgi:hypothetical protein